MNVIFTSTQMQKPRFLGVFVALAVLAGCSAPAGQIYDPAEPLNRQFHAVNIGLDKAVLRPIATATVRPGGGPVSQGVLNFASNLSGPSTVLNNLLQLRLGQAVENTLKFAINTTIGIGGLFDPAKAMGLNGRDSDFGETLHVWGFGEGAYLEPPVIGPTTARDLSGLVVDIAINPLQLWLPAPESYVGTVAGAASKVIYRGRFVQTVDSVLYESADSYAQARILYLQNRRFELGQKTASDDMIDPYEDFYAN